MARDADPPRSTLPTDAFDHLKVDPGELCWWCLVRPATTGEHKYKRTDLATLMGDDTLIWFGGGDEKEIRGKGALGRDRHGVVKFEKSMCDVCNNARSQPFDRAYDKFSAYLTSTHVRILPGVSFEDIYGASWHAQALDLARYYAKHFGCRMVRSGLPVPDSLRAFLDGADCLDDAHMAIVTTDSVRRVAGKGLTMSSDFVATGPGKTRFGSYVMAAYVGSVGVRYQWWSRGAKPHGWDSQFFNFAMPVLNCFKDEASLFAGDVRSASRFARFSQWLNRSSENTDNS